MHTLYDEDSRGQVRDWKGKKERSQLMAEHYNYVDLQSKYERIRDCAEVLTFNQTESGLKLHQAWFCKVRLCPMCNWRRSMKIALHNKKIVEEANKRENVRWIFLTLTVRNCDGEDLKPLVDDMMKAWNRFAGYAKIKKFVKGYFRALEVTKNRDDSSDWFGTYHPHFHVLLAVTPSYFTRDYLKHSDWVHYWKKAMKLNYDPVVNVQKVKPKKDLDVSSIESNIKTRIQEQKAIQEVSKYPVKDTDVLPSDEFTKEGAETVYTLDKALSSKRLISYGGILKEIHQELNLSDVEDENDDLVHTDSDDEVANAVTQVIAYWHYGIQNYVLHE